MENATEFFDKSGKRIYIGDTLQLRLGKFAKKVGGPTMSKVIRFGKRVQLIAVTDETNKYGGHDLMKQVAKISVIVDREFFR